MKSIVTVLNLQNAIVHPEGFVGRHGNADHVAKRGVLTNTAELLKSARRAAVPIIYVGSGFDKNYTGLNPTVAQFKDLQAQGRMRIGSWESRFHDLIAPEEVDTILYRGGLGAFASTSIGSLLPPANGARVYVAGVSTRLVVEAAVFELTDRGYAVSVVEDCCAAATAEAHDDAITVLSRFASIESVSSVTAAW